MLVTLPDAVLLPSTMTHRKSMFWSYVLFKSGFAQVKPFRFEAFALSTTTPPKEWVVMPPNQASMVFILKMNTNSRACCQPRSSSKKTRVHFISCDFLAPGTLCARNMVKPNAFKYNCFTTQDNTMHARLHIMAQHYRFVPHFMSLIE